MVRKKILEINIWPNSASPVFETIGNKTLDIAYNAAKSLVEEGSCKGISAKMYENKKGEKELRIDEIN